MKMKDALIKKSDVINAFKKKTHWSDDNPMIAFIKALEGEYLSKRFLVKAIHKRFICGYGDGIFNIIRDL